MDLFQWSTNGAGAIEPVLRSAVDKSVYSWSPDGRFLAYWASNAKTQSDLWILPLFGNQKPFAFLQTEHNEIQPEFSPDGKSIAYTSDESGRPELYVRRFEGTPASGKEWQVSITGGSHPKWRRDGQELFFLAPDRKLMSVQVRTKPEFSADIPQPLFQTHARIADYLRPYDVAANGQRFLLNVPFEDAQTAPITVVTNWRPGPP